MPRDGDLLKRRDADLAGRKDSKAYGDLVKTFEEVRKGFEDQGERAADIDENWDAYNCIIGDNQVYRGNTEYYVPIVRNAVNARKTRFLNQLFPSSGRYIDATSSDGAPPHAEVALLEHYIRAAHLKTEIIAAMLRNGDIEGQYNLLMDWDSTERHVVSRETRPPQAMIPGIGSVDGNGEDVEDLVAEEIVDAGPSFEVLHDTDVLIQPVTASSVADAIAKGGQVTVIRRWTKHTLEAMIDKKEVRRSETEHLLDMSSREETWKDAARASIDAAGIKGGGKFFLVYKTWKMLDTDEGRRLCTLLYGGYGLILSAKRIEFWNDRCPLLSVPVEKISGFAKGVPPVNAIMSHQLHANDVANEAADSMTMGMLPVFIADPNKIRTSTLIVNLGAIWEGDPTGLKPVEFPPLWRDAPAIIINDTTLAFQTLGVNPAMLPQQTGRPGARRNQAEVALEQIVDTLTTGEACSVVEEGILTPAAELMVEYDHQFREKDLTVMSFGEMGVAATMEEVPLIQLGKRYQFTWFGVEQARNAQQMQQQIAWLNVAKGMAPDLAANGFRLNPAPALEHSAGNIFGWRMGRQILVDVSAKTMISPEQENELLAQGFFVPVHPMDDVPKHLQSHMPFMQSIADPLAKAQAMDHVGSHMKQLAQAAMQQAQQQGPPGAQAQGTGPTPGAQPQGPKLVRGPPGAIHPDQMARAGAVTMPRKM